MLIFSPSFITSAFLNPSTFSPFARVAADKESVSVRFWFVTSCARFLAKLTKSSFLATKSVSQLTSTIAPLLLSVEVYAPIIPSAARRPAALLALAPLLMRSKSSAAFMSPPDSVNAFLHSIMPSPVRSRSSFTMPAVMSAISSPTKLVKISGSAAQSFGERKSRIGLT